MKTPLSQVSLQERAEIDKFFSHPYFEYFTDYLSLRREEHQKKVSKNLTAEFELYNREQSIGVVAELNSLKSAFLLHLQRAYTKSES